MITSLLSMVVLLMKALNADSAVYVADVQVISHLHGLALIRSCSLRKLSRHVMVNRMQMTAMTRVTTMMDILLTIFILSPSFSYLKVWI